MMNIGHRPTIGKNVKSIEVHLFNFNEDIYGQVISIKMISKIRDEKKFDGLRYLDCSWYEDYINGVIEPDLTHLSHDCSIDHN